MPGVVIAGTHSGCGKTTVTLGVLAALKKKGMAVQSFKAGPDFIDTGLQRMITGISSRNLDLWMCGEDYMKSCFYKHSADADISIVEGVMGLYDGEFSTAALAYVLELPVILVVDAYGMAESAGAIVKGFLEYSAEARKRRSAEVFAPKLPNFLTSGLIAGVIFNRVASERHYERLKNSVQDIPVLGYLPRDLSFEIPHRHLGLTVAEENPITSEAIERLADAVLKYVNVEHIMEYCSNEESDKRLSSPLHPFTYSPIYHFTHSPIVAIAYDKAFCFYYEDNFDLLKDAGAEILKFSPLSDSKIPDGVDAVYIGGGYPELYAVELSKNQPMLESIYNWADSGKPMYAECGGLMYLSQGIYDFKGNFFKMAGVLPFKTAMRKGRSYLGYREIQLTDDCLLGKKGDKLKGHEFHYSEIIEQQSSRTAEQQLKEIYSVRNNHGEFVNASGYKFKNTIASYVHLHFGSNPAIAGRLVRFINEYHSRASGNPVPYCHSERSEESMDSCFCRNDEKQKSIKEN